MSSKEIINGKKPGNNIVLSVTKEGDGTQILTERKKRQIARDHLNDRSGIILAFGVRIYLLASQKNGL